MGTPDIIQFNEDFIALRILARRNYSKVAKRKDLTGVPIPDELATVAPTPPEKRPWPHDRAADLIASWRIETHGRP